ncbi:three-helix bundle dimerization domain-containing protein [Rhodococcus sp. NPDC003318]|uniref:three-helix bundle dimerization domain-containing protein n=1 Tax=Rhodococcus sp. NPDC003318 TaxID=3364503 RepID=UPI00368D2665
MAKKKEDAASKEAAALKEIAEAIKKDFPDLTDGDVKAMIERAHEDFYSRPIREFVPLFIERRIRAQLAEQG